MEEDAVGAGVTHDEVDVEGVEREVVGFADGVRNRWDGLANVPGAGEGRVAGVVEDGVDDVGEGCVHDWWRGDVGGGGGAEQGVDEGELAGEDARVPGAFWTEPDEVVAVLGWEFFEGRVPEDGGGGEDDVGLDGFEGAGDGVVVEEVERGEGDPGMAAEEGGVVGGGVGPGGAGGFVDVGSDDPVDPGVTAEVLEGFVADATEAGEHEGTAGCHAEGYTGGDGKARGNQEPGAGNQPRAWLDGDVGGRDRVAGWFRDSFIGRQQEAGMEVRDRPRRLRRDRVRELVRETRLSPADLVAPVFVDATIDGRDPIPSMPGHERVGLPEVVDRVNEVVDAGVGSVLLFGIPVSKDAEGSRAWASDGVIQEAVRRVRRETDAFVITDVCLCEYTSHGHCGVLEPGAREDPVVTVDNDATLELLERIVVSHAAAGADMVAPSGMIDGMVGAIRGALDAGGYESVPVMSYAAKYQSNFYGPFRDAADGAPAFGDRRHYQMDPGNAREAAREVRLDVAEGADIVMVKPALPYLDVLAAVKDRVDVPVAAYNVSGEYAMLHAAAQKGWLDLEAVSYESVLSIKRAGADVIVTYFAEDLARRL